jgi:hypothetical protein
VRVCRWKVGLTVVITVRVRSGDHVPKDNVHWEIPDLWWFWYDVILASSGR